MLIGMSDSGQLTMANQANGNTAYYCPHCKSKLILKKGNTKVPHFAHYHLSTTYCSKSETLLHYQVKYYLAYLLKNHGYDVQIEPYIKGAYQYPDLLVNQQFALEIQFSNISITEIQKRTLGLQLRGIQVIWIADLNKIMTSQMRFNQMISSFIHPYNRNLYAFDTGSQTLKVIENIQHIGGSRFKGKLRIANIDTFFQQRKSEITHEVKRLTSTQIHRYVKSCRKARSVLEPTLSSLYQMRKNAEWLAHHCNYLFPQQLYICNHPIAWQVQLYQQLMRGDFDIHNFQKLLKFRTFYIEGPTPEMITQQIVSQFKQIERL